MPRWLRVLAFAIPMLGVLVGYGMGCTCSEVGISLRSVHGGLLGGLLLGLPALAIGALTGTFRWWAAAGWRPFHRRSGHCPQCDYPLDERGLHQCPECGVRSTEDEREPRPLDELWSAVVSWLARALVLILLSCILAQGLALLEQAIARYTAPRAFAMAISPGQTDPDPPDLAGWTPKPGQSAKTPFGWVDWQPDGTRSFRPFRWTPWPHLGALIYLERPRQNGRQMWYWID